MARTRRPVEPDRATINVLLLLNQRIGAPCPTREELMAQTGYPQRGVLAFLHELQRRGLIEIQSRGLRRANLRRMRVAGGLWTGWTSRRPERPKRSAIGPPPRLPVSAPATARSPARPARSG